MEYSDFIKSGIGAILGFLLAQFVNLASVIWEWWNQAVLVPGATVVIELAGWREDYDAIFPAVSGLPDYYDEICSLATEYRFTVVAFDDKAHFVRKVLTVGYRFRNTERN